MSQEPSLPLPLSREQYLLTHEAHEVVIEGPDQDDDISAAWKLWTGLGRMLFRPRMQRLIAEPHVSWELRWSGSQMTTMLWVPGTVPVEAVRHLLSTALPSARITIRPAMAPLPIPRADRQASTHVLPADPPASEPALAVEVLGLVEDSIDLGVCLAPAGPWTNPSPRYALYRHPDWSTRLRQVAPGKDQRACVQILARPHSQDWAAPDLLAPGQDALTAARHDRDQRWQVHIRIALSTQVRRPVADPLHESSTGSRRLQLNTEPTLHRLQACLDQAASGLNGAVLVSELAQPSRQLAERHLTGTSAVSTLELAWMTGPVTAAGRPS